MKQDTADFMVRAWPALLGVGVTWTVQEVSIVVALFSGLATLLYVVIQTVFLIRKWYILEKMNWAVKTDTDFGHFQDTKPDEHH